MSNSLSPDTLCSKEKELLFSSRALFLFIGIEYLVVDDVSDLTLLFNYGILLA